jgi:ATP-dependent DNA helicase RecG
MVEVSSLENFEALAETVELECKLAAGQDGKGQLPKDFWPTYSAFANTHGGVVLLGVREKHGQFSVQGVPEPQRVVTDLFNTLNNHQKVSVNLLTDDDVTILIQDRKSVIQVKIPAATRKQKPVYLNGNPLGNTFKRLHEGDRLCDDETVRRMLAEQVEDERDRKILVGFTMADLDAESLRIYRQLFRDAKPGHPWLELADQEFLAQLKGWRRDRQTGEEGLTLAGLLMFGRWESIQEAVPHYFVDYQERSESPTERWSDRLIPDGTWSGNVFDFYRRVYRKLVTDLKIPFMLKADQRQDDTPVHQALREALVNMLVHADYTGRISILVVKQADLFEFRNPGTMRVSLEQAIQGGESDCRNRLMHQMFLMIGLGERAGSGIPKIYSGWSSQHWRPPKLEDRDEPEQTLLTLRMLDLLPEEVTRRLQRQFGEGFNQLPELERLIVATAAIEQVVTHGRLRAITTGHNHDLTLALQKLVRLGFLKSSGKTRGTVYSLHGTNLPTPDDVFSPKILESAQASSEHLTASSEYLMASSEHSLEQRDFQGCLITGYFDKPIVDDLGTLTTDFRARLENLAMEARTKRRLPQEVMKEVILAVCQDQYLTLNVLSQLVNRDQDALRQQYLNKMVKEQKLSLAFPSTPTHPKQAYIVNDPAENCWRIGNDLFLEARYEEALISYDEAIKLKPDNPNIWFNKGAALRRLSRYEEALISFGKAIELKPDNPNIWFNKGAALRRLSRYEEALVSYDKAIELKSDDPDIWLIKGGVFVRLSRYEEALISFEKAIELKSDDPDAWVIKGVVLDRLSRHEEALVSYDKAIELKPDYPDAWFKKGVALGRIDHHKEAIKSFDKVIELKPDYPSAYFNRACVYGLLKEVDKAISDLREAIKLDPSDLEESVTDPDFDKIRQDDRFQQLLADNSKSHA